eukprot:gene12988-17416_t
MYPNSLEKRHSHHQFITAGGTLSRPKFTTKHLAALDFLSNIPLERESIIRENGMKNVLKLKALEEEINEEVDDGESIDEDEKQKYQQAVPQDGLDLHTDLPGKKLGGPTTRSARIPPVFRYCMQRISDQSAQSGAAVRQWEEQMLITGGMIPPQPMLASRIYFSRARSYPVMVCSIIKYDAGEEKAKIDKIKAEDQKGLEVFDLPKRDWRGLSYKPLFKPVQNNDDQRSDHRGFLFDPNALDDPELIHGSNKYVLQRAASTGPIISSIILFANEKELKASLNEEFRERHPHLPPSLTLSRIRKLKKRILLFCLSIEIELSTVAIAFINFERLCLKCLVTKANRRLAMAVSIVLAYKFNENSTTTENSLTDYHKILASLFQYFDTEWDLDKKQVFDAEFGAFVHLGFSLHIPYQHIHSVYSRLLKMANQTGKQYLGDEMNEMYRQDIVELEQARAAHDLEKDLLMRANELELLQQQQQQQQQQDQEELEENNNNSNKYDKSKKVGSSSGLGIRLLRFDTPAKDQSTDNNPLSRWQRSASFGGWNNNDNSPQRQQAQDDGLKKRLHSRLINTNSKNITSNVNGNNNLLLENQSEIEHDMIFQDHEHEYYGDEYNNLSNNPLDLKSNESIIDVVLTDTQHDDIRSNNNSNSHSVNV